MTHTDCVDGAWTGYRDGHSPLSLSSLRLWFSLWGKHIVKGTFALRRLPWSHLLLHPHLLAGTRHSKDSLLVQDTQVDWFQAHPFQASAQAQSRRAAPAGPPGLPA